LANSDGALLTVSQARKLLMAGFQALEERKQEINDLNVYPVPDGDTGTNLALTMRSLIDAVAKLSDDLPADELCAAISQAALMGARGNSGVILSQIIRGAMETFSREGPVTGNVLAEAFLNATETAYRAVRKPVEGTILTVLRDMSEAASQLPGGTERKVMMDTTIAAGWKSVERTPTLLRVLADAGVVDAGGYGLVVLIEGAASGRGDWQTPIATRLGQPPVADGALYETEDADEQSDFTYCTSFLLSGRGLDRSALESLFGPLGDSLLVVGDENQMKVHVHTDDPGQVLTLASTRGVLGEIEIDNMKEQTAARTERLARGGNQASQAGPSSGRQPGVEPGLTQVVAVVAGEGNKALFRSLGVDLIVDGGQSMNPSAEDLIREVERAVARSVIILPNNSNVIMTAEQTLGLTGREVHVVPTRSIQAGLSAAVVYERRSPGYENARMMRAAVENVVSGEVTRAVRDSLVDGLQVKAGDFIGLIDERIVVTAPDIEAVVHDLVSKMVTSDSEMLTLLTGEDVDSTSMEGLIDELREHYPSVEIDVREGGQPYYPVLLAAE
jgi:DAK2 domain fusion protein YloV